MSIWKCKIGSRALLALPSGADLPMRQAIQRAFYELTGEYAEFTFSGWGAELTAGEQLCVAEQPGTDPTIEAELLMYPEDHAHG